MTSKDTNTTRVSWLSKEGVTVYDVQENGVWNNLVSYKQHFKDTLKDEELPMKFPYACESLVCKHFKFPNHALSCLIVHIVKYSKYQKTHIDNIASQLAKVNNFYYEMPVWELNSKIRDTVKIKDSAIHLENDFCYLRSALKMLGNACSINLKSGQKASVFINSEKNHPDCMGIETSSDNYLPEIIEILSDSQSTPEPMIHETTYSNYFEKSSTSITGDNTCPKDSSFNNLFGPENIQLEILASDSQSTPELIIDETNDYEGRSFASMTADNRCSSIQNIYSPENIQMEILSDSQSTPELMVDDTSCSNYYEARSSAFITADIGCPNSSSLQNIYSPENIKIEALSDSRLTPELMIDDHSHYYEQRNFESTTADNSYPNGLNFSNYYDGRSLAPVTADNSYPNYWEIKNRYFSKSVPETTYSNYYDRRNFASVTADHRCPQDWNIRNRQLIKSEPETTYSNYYDGRSFASVTADYRCPKDWNIRNRHCFKSEPETAYSNYEGRSSGFVTSDNSLQRSFKHDSEITYSNYVGRSSRSTTRSDNSYQQGLSFKNSFTSSPARTENSKLRDFKMRVARGGGSTRESLISKSNVISKFRNPENNPEEYITLQIINVFNRARSKVLSIKYLTDRMTMLSAQFDDNQVFSALIKHPEIFEEAYTPGCIYSNWKLRRNTSYGMSWKEIIVTILREKPLTIYEIKSRIQKRFPKATYLRHWESSVSANLTRQRCFRQTKSDCLWHFSYEDYKKMLRKEKPSSKKRGSWN